MQVLSNLIGNAIKFTPAKGRICVSCQRTGPEGEKLEISISDTGEGIPRRKLKQSLSVSHSYITRIVAV